MTNDIPEVLQSLFLKNLNYFKKTNSAIYTLLNTTKIVEKNIKIDEEGKIDLIYKNQPIYEGDAISFAQEEVNRFQEAFKEKVLYKDSYLAKPDMYVVPRFFQQHINNTVKEFFTSLDGIYDHAFHLDDSYDFLVVTGIGLGLHITEIIETNDVQNLLIYETDSEFLALSCFFTDWESLYEKQSIENGKSLTIIAFGHVDEDVEYGMLWNELIVRTPHFPAHTVFYNHGGHSKYGKFIRKIKDDQKMFVGLWGHYDDEANQLNHIFHNINSNYKLIPAKDSYTWEKPVFICGSGPSLDNRIEQIKENRDHIVLISAGTSLSPLLKSNITPDFHVEIESDYDICHIFEEIENKEALRDIILITGIQSSPYIFKYFNESYIFVKDSLSCGDIVESEKNNKLSDPTPTCVNAALSFALHYNPDEVYLFGTDFGFYDKNNHHSKDSIYSEDNKIGLIHDNLMKDIADKSFKQEGYLGDCLTTDIYFTTKRRVEMRVKLASFQQTTKINTCSDGLIISGTHHIDLSSKLNIKDNSNPIEFCNNTRELAPEISDKIKHTLNQSIIELADLFILNIEKMDISLSGISRITWDISNYMASGFNKKYGSISFFIRGTMWHYMLVGFSTAHACKGDDQKKAIIIWKNRMLDFLSKIKLDLNELLYKNRDNIDNDKSLKLNINSEIPKD